MAGHQAQAVVESAVLIGADGIGEIGIIEDHRQAAFQ